MEKYSNNQLQYLLSFKITRMPNLIFNKPAIYSSNVLVNFQIAILIRTAHLLQLIKILKQLNRCLRSCMSKCRAATKLQLSHQWVCTIFAYLNHQERQMISYMRTSNCTGMKRIQQPHLNYRLMYYSLLKRLQYSVHAVSYCLQKKWIEACCDHFDEVLDLIEDI